MPFVRVNATEYSIILIIDVAFTRENHKKKYLKSGKTKPSSEMKVIDKCHKKSENRRIKHRGGKFCFFGISKCNPLNEPNDLQKRQIGQ